MNYTKGEWYIGEKKRCFVNIETDEVVIASVGTEYPEGLPNARLISAAPDMYEALKMVIASVPFAAYRGDGELEEVERVVLVALNKAEGRG